MKKIRIFGVMTLGSVACLTACHTKQTALAQPTVNWLGCPMVSNDDRWTPSSGWIANAEIGLRSDGTVVWRARKPTERTP